MSLRLIFLRPQYRAMLALCGVILAWSYGWIVMKQALQYAGPLDFVALRGAGAAAVLLIFMALSRQSLRLPPFFPTFIIGISQTVGFQGLSQVALLAGGTGQISMLAYTMPFWSVFLAWWLLDEPPARHQWAAIVFAAIGLTCLIQPWSGLGTLLSMLLALTSAICWALGTILSKKMFQRYKVSVMALTTWQMVFGAIAMAVVAFLAPGREIDWTGELIFDLAYIIIIATSLAWFMWLYVVKSLPTTVASLSSLGVPVSVTLLAWLILNESLNGMEIIGLILIGCGLVSVGGTVQFLRSCLHGKKEV